MTMADMLANELTREAVTTRRLLERVPDAQLTWKPHEKSMTIGKLAHHIAAMPRAITGLMRELVSGPPQISLRDDLPSAELVAMLDEAVPFAIAQFQAWGDAGLSEMWRLENQGQTLFEMPRAAVARTVMLNHWYHHRGQLSVYLRLLDIAVPSVYGPTADEQVFGDRS
jgi:uncharacterized damage-inducible protein DinB